MIELRNILSRMSKDPFSPSLYAMVCHRRVSDVNEARARSLTRRLRASGSPGKAALKTPLGLI